MQTSWLQLMRQAGDDHVGQTLVRLARLAEAVHARQFAAEMPFARKERRRPQGRGSESAVAPPGAGPVHTEVSR